MKKSELKQIIREELIKELFDTKEKVKWTTEDGVFDYDDYSAIFTGPNNRKYEIELQNMELLDLPREVYVLIRGGLPKSSYPELFDAFVEQGYHIEFGDDEEGKGVTGLGGQEAAKIFGIVINAVIDKVKQEKINYVYFSAKEASRQALYKKIAPIIASRLGMKQFNNGHYYFLYK